MTSTRRVRVIGPGRAGQSFARALEGAGWRVEPHIAGRGDDVSPLAQGVDLLLMCTPDAAIATVAQSVEPNPDCVIAHIAGSLPLEVLRPHSRVASIHPLVSLPDPETGSRRLQEGAFFAVAGDPLAVNVVESLRGRWAEVSDDHRAIYHATACIASNHLVALMGQVERLAQMSGVPAEAFFDLARGSLDNASTFGAATALTGPAARGDQVTIERHLRALPLDERGTYLALVAEAERLAGKDVTTWTS